MASNPQQTITREIGRDLYLSNGDAEMVVGVSGDLAYFRADAFIIDKADAERIIAHLQRHFRIRQSRVMAA